MYIRFVMMWLAAVSFTLTGSAVHAESFRYDHTYYNPGIGYYNFVYESPSLITTDKAPLTPSSLYSSRIAMQPSRYSGSIGQGPDMGRKYSFNIESASIFLSGGIKHQWLFFYVD